MTNRIQGQCGLAPAARAPMSEPTPPDRLGRTILLGVVVGLGMLVAVAAWVVTARIDGAVIAPAQVVVDSNRKTVQHLEGGIVREILVKEGDLVQAEDVLFRLDVTQDRAALAALDDRLTDLAARRARLQAELAEAEEIAWPPLVLGRAQWPRTAAAMAAQQKLFSSRRDAQLANARLLTRRSAALQARIDGLAKQQAAMRKELAISIEEEALLATLRDSKLIPLPRLLELRRAIVRLESRLAEAAGETLSLAAQIQEIAAQRQQDNAVFREQAAAELAEVQAESGELEEQQGTLRDRLKRREIRAPLAGHVFNLAVHTRGAVVAPGDPLLEIVPLHDDLVLQARIPASEIERVSPGQSTRVRMTAFNRNSTPELTGALETVSADAKVDEQSGAAYFSALVRLSSEQLDQLNGRVLSPGMPAEVLILTGERLVASYLTRPLQDSYARAFRDE